jgi:hypothetical protein
MKHFTFLTIILISSFSLCQRPNLETGSYYYSEDYSAIISKRNNKYIFTLESTVGTRATYSETYFNDQLDILVVYNSDNDDQLKINVNARSFRVWSGSEDWGGWVPYMRPYALKEWYHKN